VQDLDKDGVFQLLPSKRLPPLFHASRTVFTEAFRPYLEANTLRVPDIGLAPPYSNRLEGTKFLAKWLFLTGHLGAVRSVVFPDTLLYVGARGWNDNECLWRIVAHLVASLSGLKCVTVPLWWPYGVLAVGLASGDRRFARRLRAVIKAALAANPTDLKLRVVGTSPYEPSVRRRFVEWLEGQFPVGGKTVLTIELQDSMSESMGKFWFT
jgi:hypothetical protein